MSALLGSGRAPARAFDGGSALSATPVVSVAANANDGGCRSTLLIATTVRCRLPRGHEHPWHVRAGWEWTDDGRYRRARDLGPGPLVFAPCVDGEPPRWSCRCPGCRARWCWLVARACGRVR